MSTTTETGVVIANILPTLKDMPAILDSNRTRATRAQIAVVDLQKELDAKLPEQPGKVITEEQDARVMETITRISAQEKKMMGERSPFTQMMTMIAKEFTGEEAKLAPLKAKLQVYRDNRAAFVIAENKRKEEEARKKAQKDQERADIVAAITLSIGKCLSDKMFSRKTELNNAFNSMTLDDIDERGSRLRSISIVFPGHKVNDFLIYTQPAGRLHTTAEVEEINTQVRAKYDFDTFYGNYFEEMRVFQQGLVDRIDSKKAELVRAKELADEAVRLAEEQRLADIRQKELQQQQQQAKNQAEKTRLEKEAEDNRIRNAEIRRQQEEARVLKENQDKEAEKNRLAAEQKAEQDRIAQEKENTRQAEQARTQSHAVSLFDQANVANVKEAEGETRKGWDIQVTEAAGWVEIHQFWFLNASATLWVKEPEAFEGMTYGKMKAFAEKMMKDKNLKIESPYLTYTETAKAVNRKKK